MCFHPIIETDGVLYFLFNKLDECEVLKQKKMGRITMTLMNKALLPTHNKDGNVAKYLNTQLKTTFGGLVAFRFVSFFYYIFRIILLSMSKHYNYETLL